MPGAVDARTDQEPRPDDGSAGQIDEASVRGEQALASLSSIVPTPTPSCGTTSPRAMWICGRCSPASFRKTGPRMAARLGVMDPIVDALLAGEAVTIHRYELPDFHEQAPPRGGDPGDLLTLGPDDVLRPFDASPFSGGAACPLPSTTYGGHRHPQSAAAAPPNRGAPDAATSWRCPPSWRPGAPASTPPARAAPGRRVATPWPRPGGWVVAAAAPAATWAARRSGRRPHRTGAGHAAGCAATDGSG